LFPIAGLLFIIIEAPVSAFEPSASIALTARLADWKKEIEERGTGRIVLVRVYTDHEQNRIVLPGDTEQRDILRRYFLNASFIDEFVEMHGINLNYRGPEGVFHFVLLNMARAAEWVEHEEAVLAHELGHVWLHAMNYPAAVYEGAADSCLTIQAGDAVQHVLIRQELARRGIPYVPYWTGNLAKLLDALERNEARSAGNRPACQAGARVVIWLDARLGLSAETWECYEPFMDAMKSAFPELEPQVDRLVALISSENLEDPGVHLRVLRQVLIAMHALASSPPQGEGEPDRR
jgi:hypothetical protein